MSKVSLEMGSSADESYLAYEASLVSLPSPGIEYGEDFISNDVLRDALASMKQLNVHNSTRRSDEVKATERPGTPLWKTFRWKAWAIKKGLIPRPPSTSVTTNTAVASAEFEGHWGEEESEESFETDEEEYDRESTGENFPTPPPPTTEVLTILDKKTNLEEVAGEDEDGEIRGLCDTAWDNVRPHPFIIKDFCKHYWNAHKRSKGDDEINPYNSETRFCQKYYPYQELTPEYTLEDLVNMADEFEDMRKRKCQDADDADSVRSNVSCATLPRPVRNGVVTPPATRQDDPSIPLCHMWAEVYQLSLESKEASQRGESLSVFKWNAGRKSSVEKKASRNIECLSSDHQIDNAQPATESQQTQEKSESQGSGKQEYSALVANEEEDGRYNEETSGEDNRWSAVERTWNEDEWKGEYESEEGMAEENVILKSPVTPLELLGKSLLNSPSGSAGENVVNFNASDYKIAHEYHDIGKACSQGFPCDDKFSLILNDLSENKQ